MEKQIFILNGAPYAGKDTFANLLNEIIPTKHISSIDPVKSAARQLGWNGEKDLDSRKFLSEFKQFVNEHSTYIWDYLDGEVAKFRGRETEQVLLIDIREIEEIQLAVKRYNAKTIFIDRGIEEKITVGNPSDEVALDKDAYHYDHIIDNFVRTLDDLRKSVKVFVKSFF